MSSTVRGLAAALAVVVSLTGCSLTAAGDTIPATSAAKQIRLGYFANITHAPALVGLENGLFEEALGSTKITTQVFSAGPAAIEALSAGAIDAAFIGPGPALNSYVKSGGASLVVVAGVSTGGAALVVRSGITSAADLTDTSLATPGLGNTQDVALRSWLADEGYDTSITGGGDVTISPSENADTLRLFQAGRVDGAWLPEPWVSRLVLEGGGHVLVDEASLWPDGAFPTTVLAVNTSFLAAHPQTVKALVAGEVASVDWINSNSPTAAAAINEQIAVATGQGLSASVLDRALENVAFSTDPQAQTFATIFRHAVGAGTATGDESDLDGLFDLSFLNEILASRGAPTVSSHGLGKE